ncbi:MAG: hypothetical protein AAF959_27825, partial [Cyanobacteria bacterium P01_D01_bin.56]
SVRLTMGSSTLDYGVSFDSVRSTMGFGTLDYGVVPIKRCCYGHYTQFSGIPKKRLMPSLILPNLLQR